MFEVLTQNDCIFNQTNFNQDENLNKKFLSDKENNELRQGTSSGPTLATAMLEKIFTENELIEGNLTGRGREKNSIKSVLIQKKLDS